MTHCELGFRAVLRTKWVGPRAVRGYNFGIPGIQTIYFELGFLQLKFSWLNFHHFSRGGY
jgi:hypothetical protein